MHKLLEIKEDSVRDLELHYNGSVIYDNKEGKYMLMRGFEGGPKRVIVHYFDSKKNAGELETTLEYIRNNWSAICLKDGYINLNGYCLRVERTYDRKYKKTTTMNNTSVSALGALYINVNNKRVKRELDAYTVLKASQQRYYDFEQALKKTQTMFSVAMSPTLALVLQPVKEGDSKVHVVYEHVYVGEVHNERIVFDNDEIRELVIEQLQEVGYAA